MNFKEQQKTKINTSWYFSHSEVKVSETKRLYQQWSHTDRHLFKIDVQGMFVGLLALNQLKSLKHIFLGYPKIYKHLYVYIIIWII